MVKLIKEVKLKQEIEIEVSLEDLLINGEWGNFEEVIETIVNFDLHMGNWEFTIKLLCALLNGLYEVDDLKDNLMNWKHTFIADVGEENWNEFCQLIERLHRDINNI